MSDQSEAISNYILAKDGNRPWLMPRTFAEDALLEVVVRPNSISFPPSASGIAAITETLVRQFSLDNENIYTFCLSAKPEGFEHRTSANWRRTFLHRSKREKPDQKGTRAQFKALLSAAATHCFSTESAHSGLSLRS